MPFLQPIASPTPTKQVAPASDYSGPVNSSAFPAQPFPIPQFLVTTGALSCSALVATLLQLLGFNPINSKQGKVPFLPPLPAGSSQWYHPVPIGNKKPT